jgi:hypothetical protein
MAFRNIRVFLVLFMVLVALALGGRQKRRASAHQQLRGNDSPVEVNSTAYNRGAAMVVADSDDEADDTDDDKADDDADDNDDNTAMTATNLAVVKNEGPGTEGEKARLQQSVYDAHEKLTDNMRDQVNLNQEEKDLEDVEKSHRMIDQSVKAVEKETQSPAMASFLGDMWKEMRMFAQPFYQEHLEEERAKLEKKQPQLSSEFDKSQAALSDWTPNAVATLTYTADSLSYKPGSK